MTRVHTPTSRPGPGSAAIHWVNGTDRPRGDRRPAVPGQPYAPIRPLASPGSGGRVLPFAIVAGLAFPTIPFATIDNLSALVAATVIFVVIVSGALVLPWQRWPAWCEVIPVYGFLAVIALLREGAGGGASGYGPLAILPVVWLALYHNRWQLIVGLVLEAAVFFVPPVAIGGPAYPMAELRRTLLLVAVSGVVGVTTHRLVARKRRNTVALAEAAARIRRDHEFTSTVLDTANHLVLVLDGNYRIQLFNRSCEQLTGRRLRDVAGDPAWWLFARPGEVAAAGQAFTSVLAGRYPQHGESDWLATDGARHRVAWTSTALRDESGKISHILVTALDVTERRKLERLFADVLEAATEQAIIGSDSDGLVTVFNVGAQRLLGYRPDEVKHRSTLTSFHDPAEIADRAAELGIAPGFEVIAGRARAGDTETREWTYVRKDGSHVPVSLTTNSIRDAAGEIVGFVGIARDVTADREATQALVEAYERERAASERLRQLDQVRSDFVSSVSHDLRTPLTSVLGYVEMLLDGDAGDLTPGQSRLLEVAHRNARRLLALVQDILLISRIDAGMFTLSRHPVSIDKVVNGALEALGQPVGRDVRISVATPDDPLIVEADTEQLERALTNLIGNAVKFTPDGGRVVLTAAAESGMAVLRVSDTGVGIPVEELPRVFDRFFRSSRTQRQGIQGTGLGLAITKAIIEAHGGSIEAASEPGQGTTVSFTVPLAQPGTFAG